MTRTNFSPGQYRDLDKPLVETEADAPRHERVVDRFLSGYLWVMLWAGVLAFTLLLVAAVVVILTGG